MRRTSVRRILQSTEVTRNDGYDDVERRSAVIVEKLVKKAYQILVDLLYPSSQPFLNTDVMTEDFYGSGLRISPRKIFPTSRTADHRKSCQFTFRTSDQICKRQRSEKLGRAERVNCVRGINCTSHAFAVGREHPLVSVAITASQAQSTSGQRITARPPSHYEIPPHAAAQHAIKHPCLCTYFGVLRAISLRKPA